MMKYIENKSKALIVIRNIFWLVTLVILLVGMFGPILVNSSNETVDMWHAPSTWLVKIDAIEMFKNLFKVLKLGKGITESHIPVISIAGIFGVSIIVGAVFFIIYLIKGLKGIAGVADGHVEVGASILMGLHGILIIAAYSMAYQKNDDLLSLRYDMQLNEKICICMYFGMYLFTVICNLCSKNKGYGYYRRFLVAFINLLVVIVTTYFVIKPHMLTKAVDLKHGIGYVYGNIATGSAILKIYIVGAICTILCALQFILTSVQTFKYNPNSNYIISVFFCAICILLPLSYRSSDKSLSAIGYTFANDVYPIMLYGVVSFITSLFALLINYLLRAEYKKVEAVINEQAPLVAMDAIENSNDTNENIKEEPNIAFVSEEDKKIIEEE